MTYLARTCPCCGSPDHRTYPALVSSFVASYVFRTRPALTRLLECVQCGFRFFEQRFTDAEAAALYAGYRGERYYRERHRHEPWYTRKANDAIGGDERVIRERRALLEGFLRDHVDVSTIEDVLDFGGDRGQFIPRLGRNRSVFEISGSEPVAGVTKISSASELKGKTYDLVLLSHVLEHCSNPRAIVNEVLPLLRSRESLLYVELPLERIDLRWIRQTRGYAKYLELLARSGPIRMAVDLYSTGFRMKFDRVPPWGFLKMHEHINFFDQRSLSQLLAGCRLRVVAMEDKGIHSSLGPARLLCAVASPM